MLQFLIDYYDILGIYDRLSLVRLKIREMTELSFVVKEGIQHMDAVSDISASCMGSFYSMLENMTEDLNCIMDDYKKILNKEKTEEQEDGVQEI